MAAVGAGAAAAAKRPNILFVMVDEMRWDVMGCAGHPMVKTPNLDRLAQQGVRFHSCYTVSPVCSPARASAFSGRHAHVHGVTTNGMPAHTGEIFLPSILQHYGYHTAICGKLHFRPVQEAYGFDEFYSFSAEGPTPEKGHTAYLRDKHQGGKWAAAPETRPWPDHPLGKDVGRFLYPKEDFETEWLTQRSIDYLRSRQGKPQPWFLYTSYLKPHSPSVEPEPYFSMYDPAKVPVPKLPEVRPLSADDERHEMHDVEMQRRMTALYFGAVTHVDAEIGRLLGELDKLGMTGNTLIVFTADHGNMLGDRGRWFKGVHYDGSARIPLLWRGVNGPKGRVVNTPVDNTDLLPSLLESAGLPVPAGVQGKSFLKLAAGADPGWKPRVFSQLNSGMVVEGDWKLIDQSLDGSGPFELYDRRHDPREERNLAAAQPARLAALRKQLAEFRAERPAPMRIAGMPLPAYAKITEEQRSKIGGEEVAAQRRQRKGR